jgi:hypothetical protein
MENHGLSVYLIPERPRTTKTTMVQVPGYSLTYFRNIPHGRANGLLTAEYLRFNQTVFPERVSNILGAFGLKTIDEFKPLMNTLFGYYGTMYSGRNRRVCADCESGSEHRKYSQTTEPG